MVSRIRCVLVGFAAIYNTVPIWHFATRLLPYACAEALVRRTIQQQQDAYMDQNLLITVRRQ
jgi:hypothetical protein